MHRGNGRAAGQARGIAQRAAHHRRALRLGGERSRSGDCRMTQIEDVVLTGGGAHLYRWIEEWAQLPKPEVAAAGWAHPGMAVTADGLIVTCHPGLPLLLFFDPGGMLVRSA